MYGFASAPARRFSTRRALASDAGTRRPAVRLSYPHCTLIGASWKREIRRYEFTLGASSAIAAGRYFCMPAMCAKNSGVGVPSSFEKMFFFVLLSTMLWWMCMALPGSFACGLAMNVAYIL